MDPSNLKSQFDAKLDEMAASDMITSGRYLVEFAGKEFLSALAARLSNYLRGKQFSGKELADELWEQLRRLYKPNGFYVTDEFAELATILKNHSR